MAVEEPEVAPVATEEPPVESQEEDVGPPVPKKRKAVNANELNLLENLPAADRYERSYMHRNGPLLSAPFQFNFSQSDQSEPRSSSPQSPSQTSSLHALPTGT